MVIDMDNVSRGHARVVKRDDGIYVEDLQSTNGTYVNDIEVKADRLRNGDLLKIGGAILKFIQGGNIEAQYHEEIYRMTIVDGLTQIHNKRYFLEFLDREMARCSRYDRRCRW
jgi:two-component system cell cycle response regulator